ncbi:MAG: hypothetical protein L0Y58_03790 [Verrucomicrobia subdivision 3 bacterium]|nr:hypothetical protein [Limisphaerales bacterium]
MKEFFRRLEAAPPASNAEEALALVSRMIEEVEDDLCPLPRQDPPPRFFTGRMYAPQEDSVKRFPNGIVRATTRRHRIVCGSNGSISVFHIRLRTLELHKEGKNERAP